MNDSQAVPPGTRGTVIVDEQGNLFVGYIRRLTPRECFRLQGFTDEQFDKVIAIGMSDLS